MDSLGLDDIDFIKIDTEGYEEAVLQGAEHTVLRDRPTIIVEQKRDMAKARFGFRPLGAVELLKSWGYRVVDEISGDFIMTPK
jgi:hypothetical protein